MHESRNVLHDLVPGYDALGLLLSGIRRVLGLSADFQEYFLNFAVRHFRTCAQKDVELFFHRLVLHAFQNVLDLLRRMPDLHHLPHAFEVVVSERRSVRENRFGFLSYETVQCVEGARICFRKGFDDFLPIFRPRVFAFSDKAGSVREFKDERVVVASEIRTEHVAEFLFPTAHVRERKVVGESDRVENRLRMFFPPRFKNEILLVLARQRAVPVPREDARPGAVYGAPEGFVELVDFGMRQFGGGGRIRRKRPFGRVRVPDAHEKLPSSRDRDKFLVSVRLLMVYEPVEIRVRVIVLPLEIPLKEVLDLPSYFFDRRRIAGNLSANEGVPFLREEFPVFPIP